LITGNGGPVDAGCCHRRFDVLLDLSLLI